MHGENLKFTTENSGLHIINKYSQSQPIHL